MLSLEKCNGVNVITELECTLSPCSHRESCTKRDHDQHRLARRRRSSVRRVPTVPPNSSLSDPQSTRTQAARPIV